MAQNKLKRFSQRPPAVRLALTVAAVAGLFSLIVSVSLIANYFQITSVDPLNQPELLALRQQLAQAPETDPALVQQIRILDLLARKAFFTSQAHLRMGGRLLIGGVIVLLISLKLASRWTPKLPQPPESKPSEQYWAGLAHTREILGFAGVLLVGAALLAAYLTPLDLPRLPETPVAAQAAPAAAQEAALASFPDWAALQLQWPSFRGPGGFGVAHFTTAPADWDGASGKNIRWKVAPPLPGSNSPVVWNDHLFLSGATAETREVYCYDTESGALRWKQTLPKFQGTPEKPPKISEDTGYAPSSMVVHGALAYAIFVNGDLVCYDFSGNMKWGKNLGVPDNHYGHASSLIAWDNLLLIQYDQKTDPKLIALDAVSGEEAWVAKRKKISWASPICVPMASGAQVILASEQDVDAYGPKKGNLLWSVKCLDGEVAPSPAYSAGYVFVANEYATATAIRLETIGNETKASAAWEWDQSLPDVSSPVGSEKYFYVATSRGEVACLDIATGEEKWLHEFDEGFYSSPIVVGDRLYVIDRAGAMQIIKNAPEFELLGSPALGEAANATPAYLDKRIYLRTEKNLFCIESAG